MKISTLRNKFLHDRTKISRKDKKTTKNLLESKDLEEIKSNITEEIKLRFRFSIDMATSVGVSPSVPRIAKC